MLIRQLILAFVILLSSRLSADDIWHQKGPIHRVLGQPVTYTDNVKLKKLARYAYRQGVGNQPNGFCHRAVKKAIDLTQRKNTDYRKLPFDANASHKIDTTTNRAGHSAEDFLLWAWHNPVSLCRSLSLGATNTREKGNILIYSKGRCGFSKKWGHIEILIDQGKQACSDHCRVIKGACQPDLVLRPVRNCDGVIAEAQQQQKRQKKIFAQD